jgi:hypothetical protein
MMNAGVYYIGDICYVMTDDEWDEVCELTIQDNQCVSGEFTLKDGRKFAMYNTMYGDGSYYDQHGNEYSVDSGTLGCILYSDIRADKYDDIRELGTIVEITEDFTTGFNDDGVVMIGPIHIETDPVYEE